MLRSWQFNTSCRHNSLCYDESEGTHEPGCEHVAPDGRTPSWWNAPRGSACSHLWTLSFRLVWQSQIDTPSPSPFSLDFNWSVSCRSLNIQGWTERPLWREKKMRKGKERGGGRGTDVQWSDSNAAQRRRDCLFQSESPPNVTGSCLNKRSKEKHGALEVDWWACV